MAKQIDISKLIQMVNHLSSSESAIKRFAFGKKKGVSGKRVLKDPKFQRTRENAYEFRRASKKAKQIRQQLHYVTREMADKSLRTRLVSLVHRIQKSDSKSLRGERMLRDENTPQLRGFEFNINSSLSQLLAERLITKFDRISGMATLKIPLFEPEIGMKKHKGDTHIKFRFAVAALPNTEERLPRPIMTETDYIPLIGYYEGDELRVQLPAPVSDVVYCIAGISIHQIVHGTYYPLVNGLHNALTITLVDVLPEEE